MEGCDRKGGNKALRTKYEPEKGAFSQKAHIAAQQQFYPLLFNVTSSNLQYEDVTFANNEKDLRHKILDGEMGIDRIIRVTIPKLNAPLPFTVQERFREIEYQNYQDITITEYNYASEQISELYKLLASFFVYGYYDKDKNSIKQAIMLFPSELLLAIVKEDIFIEDIKKNKKEQTFITISFKTLREKGLIHFEYKQKRETPITLTSFMHVKERKGE